MNIQIFLQEINRSLFNGLMSDNQRDGLTIKLIAFENYRITDIRWSAYMLATSFHETARTMQPVEEIGKGRDKPYGQKLKYNRKPYT